MSGQMWNRRVVGVVRLPAVVALLLVQMSSLRLCQGSHGSFVCTNTTDNQTLTMGTFPDHTFAPFASPYDPMGTPIGLYYNNVECVFQLIAPAGMHVFIEFTSIVLDATCAGDYVKLNLAGGEVRTICGTQDDYIYDVYQSNTADFTFKSDAAEAGTGFEGYFTAFDPVGAGKRSPEEIRRETQYRRAPPSGKEPRHHASRSNAWLLSKRTSTQYLHQYRFQNRHQGRSALPVKNVTAIREILSTREAGEFQEEAAQQQSRLVTALAVRSSFSPDVLSFMRYATHSVDVGRFCGNACSKTRSDVLKICREFKGYM